MAKTPCSQCRGPRFDHYSGLISFKIDWFELLAVQGTLKSLLQHHSWKALILRLCLPYGPALTSIHDCWKDLIALTIQIFVGKVMCLFCNTQSRFVIAFLPRGSLLIPWLQSPFAMILEPKRKSVTAFFPFYLQWSDGTGCHDLSFFLILSIKPAFSLSSFTLIKRLFSSSLLSAITVISPFMDHCLVMVKLQLLMFIFTKILKT